MADKKVLINAKPKFSSGLSQYNFDNEIKAYDDSDPSYQDTSGLPIRPDRFVEKDLYTNTVSDELNEKIIENNLKFEGESFIKIDKLKINNAGVNHKVKNARVNVYMFTREKFNPIDGNGNFKSYETIVDDEDFQSSKIFTKYFGKQGKKKHLGEISEVTTEIVKNLNSGYNGLEFNSDDNPISLQDGEVISGVDDSDPPNPIGLLEFDPAETSTPTETEGSIINKTSSNSIYFAVWMKGDARKWWGTDRRKKRLQIFEINNTELYPTENGTQAKFNFGYSDSKNLTGRGGGGGAEAAAYKVVEFEISISTLIGSENTVSGLQEFIDQVQPPIQFNTMGATNPDPMLFLTLGPNRQLLNDSSNWNLSNQDDRYKDYFPYSKITTVDDLGNFDEEIDLQNYYDTIPRLRQKASTPGTIALRFKLIINPQNGSEINVGNITFDNNPTQAFKAFYYVVSWDDFEDKYKNLQDVLEDNPDDFFELMQKQQDDNLYKLYYQNQDAGVNQIDRKRIFNDGTEEDATATHTYNTPGIKTIKTVMFTYDLDNPNFNKSPIRWKLITSKFFLDIPLSEFPDFGELNRDDYTTLPWPHTTPVLGGISDDSIYKKSIDDVLGSGKIGRTDLIDERLLINADENDELGENILTFDLEQCRYFNTGSYGMNDLLNLVILGDYTTVFNTTNQFLRTLPGYWGGGIVDGDIPMLESEVNHYDYNGWMNVGRPDIAQFSLQDTNQPMNHPNIPPSGNPIIDNSQNQLMSGNNAGAGNDSGGQLFGGPMGGGGGMEDCFIAGTKILLSDNSYKNIEDININDVVKSYNIETKKIEDKKVNYIYDTIHTGEKNDYTIIISFKDIKNHNTFTNPYWVVDKGWCSYNPMETYKKYKIKVKQLQIGDVCLLYKDNTLIENKILNIEEVFDEIHTYNFHVDGNHNYFANNILVHNKHGQSHVPDPGTGQTGDGTEEDPGTGGDGIIRLYTEDTPHPYITHNLNGIEQTGIGPDFHPWEKLTIRWETLNLDLAPEPEQYLYTDPENNVVRFRAPVSITIAKLDPSTVIGNQHDGVHPLNLEEAKVGAFQEYYVFHGHGAYDYGYYEMTGRHREEIEWTIPAYWQNNMIVQDGLYRVFIQFHPMNGDWAAGGVGANWSNYNQPLFYLENPSWEYEEPPPPQEPRPKEIFHNPFTDSFTSNLPVPYNQIIETKNKIEDITFSNLSFNQYITNRWYAELPSNDANNGIYTHTPKHYSDNSDGINVKYLVTSNYNSSWTHLSYPRQDLQQDIFLNPDGGGSYQTDFYQNYTFQFEIKFLNWTENAPDKYFHRCSNKINDWNIPFNQDGDFDIDHTIFKRETIDGITQIKVTNQRSNVVDNSNFTYINLNEWIKITKTRNILQEYKYTSNDEPTSTAGFPVMEFLTTGWHHALDNGYEINEENPAILEFEIRKTIMTKTSDFETTPEEELLSGDKIYWDGVINKFPDESSVGEIFINDINNDVIVQGGILNNLNLKRDCKFELNTGNLTDRSIYDSSGNSNKGLLIGDYKLRKATQGERMRRDSFVKIPKKASKSRGAL